MARRSILLNKSLMPPFCFEKHLNSLINHQHHQQQHHNHCYNRHHHEKTPHCHIVYNNMIQYATNPKVNSYIPGKFDHISLLSALGTDSYPLHVEQAFLDSRQNSNEVNVFCLNVFLSIVHATNIRG